MIDLTSDYSFGILGHFHGGYRAIAAIAAKVMVYVFPS